MKQDGKLIESREERQNKRAYKRPEIISYGNIREITQTLGNTGVVDGGNVPSGKGKTSP